MIHRSDLNFFNYTVSVRKYPKTMLQCYNSSKTVYINYKPINIDNFYDNILITSYNFLLHFWNIYNIQCSQKVTSISPCFSYSLAEIGKKAVTSIVTGKLGLNSLYSPILEAFPKGVTFSGHKRRGNQYFKILPKIFKTNSRKVNSLSET